MLEAVNLAQRLAKADYKAQLPAMQRRLHRLQRACWEAKLATLVVFEGWDAAGKGTAISKLTERLEPRRFSLHAVRQPRTFETHLPWMWRFWSKVPNWGEMAIFDRSWYGRVLVERVEKLVGKKQWRDAYADIVSFERSLANDRYLIVKFFLHISKKEQKKRLLKLESDPSTSWQVDAEDWEHHRKYKKYRVAVEEMLERTESEWGPWTLVAATDRRWVRATMFDTIIRTIEDGLERHGYEVPEIDNWDEADDDPSDDLPAED